MSDKKLTVTGTGDALFVAPFPENYNTEYKEVADFINSCDVKITNLETNLSDFEYPAGAYSGGTWINTKREYLKYLTGYGFNFYGTANNHAMDYGKEGLLSTVRELDKNGLAHAGTGESLLQAEKPAILTLDGKKIGIFAVDTSFEVASKAGRATPHVKARAGVNYLRHSKYFHITKKQMTELKEVAKTTRINFTKDMLINTGFLAPDVDGTFSFGGTVFTTDTTLPTSRCNKTDLKRITDNIKRAKTECDYVFVQAHCHDNDGYSHSSPPEYLKELCRACIDAGASAIFGGGCHELRPIEIYKNKPIFYSLGDFIYQGLQVEYLPADFMEKFGADINISASEALYIRSRGNKVGLHLMEENYLTVLPKIDFVNGDMINLTVMPVDLNFDVKDDRNGLPKLSRGEKGREIIDLLNNLSKPYGTKIEFIDGEYRVLGVEK